MESDATNVGVQIKLTADEAVVLFELLSRWAESQPPATPDAACFENKAECAVLNNLLASLEKQLAAPLQADYQKILHDARNALSHQWSYPTLNG